MQDILDISSGDGDRGHLKRRLLRIAVPIGCVALLMAAILGIAWFNYTHNRKDALALSEDLLHSLDRRIATEVRTFLSPASEMVTILHDTLRQAADWDERRELGEPLAMQMLNTISQLAIFSFADTQGNYMMLKKMPDQSIHTKLIQIEASSVKVTWTRRRPDGQETAKEYLEGDSFDPRVRPWYTGAVATSGVFWTDMYIFFTDKQPGITAAKALRNDQGELLGVMGLDIELIKLSNFLGTLQIGRKGQAMIIDDTGRLVAFPEIDRMLKKKDGRVVAARLNEMGDPILDRAFNRFMIEKSGRRELLVNEMKYINTISSLRSTVAKNWSILIVVPADDFVGFVSRNHRKTLFMSVAVLALASLLAGLLIWQGLRADRNAGLLLARRKEMETQSQAFSDLAATPSIFDSADTAGLETLTRITAQSVGVRRVSVWQWQSGGRALVCSDCYDRESDGHTRGTVFLGHDLPQLFAALGEKNSLSIEKVDHDPRTAELHRVYFNPMGCNGLLSIPIVDDAQSRGVLWFEQEGATHRWRPEELSFARAIAGLLALRLSAAHEQSECVPASDAGIASAAFRPGDAVAVSAPADRGESAGGAQPVVQAAAEMRQSTIVDLRTQAFRKQIARTAGPEAMGTDMAEDVTVMVLQFTDPIALAERLGGQASTTVVDRLIDHLETLASASGVEYMKLLGDQLVCAAGLQDDSIGNHPGVIATLALEIQDICLRIFEDASNTLAFRIGLDTGAVIGSMVGRVHKTYNLWGDAVRTAAMMAESGSTGEVHVSESTYRRLQNAYLFKTRGQYYLPTIGELSTYILTGQL